MPIRLTGMTSGLDTEALVSELVSAYRKKGEKYTKAQTKLEWKQDAWKSLNTKAYSFYTNISSLRFSSAYSLKNTSVSNSTKASITASNSAVNGTQTLNITSLAKSGYLTGGRLSTANNKNAAASTKLSALGFGGTSGTISVNGKEVTLTANSTVADAVNALKDAGVNASFDETNQRIFVSSKESGKANDFTLSALDSNGANALKALGLFTKSTQTDILYGKYQALAGKSDDELNTLINTYNNKVGVVEQTKLASSNLDRAIAYANALTTKADAEAKVTDGNLEKAKELLMDGSKFVAADGTVYSKGKDGTGKDCYIKEGDEVDEDGRAKNPYYLTTVTKEETKKNDKGETVKEKVTTYSLSTEKNSEGVGDKGGFEVSTAYGYLEKTYGIKSEEATAYVRANATEETFNAMVEAEEKDGSKLTGTPYAGYSLAAMKETVDNGTWNADALVTRKEQVDTENEQAQDWMDANDVLSNYAEQYAQADADKTKTDAQKVALKASILTELKEHITFAGNAGTDYNSDAVRVDGADAVIYLNGAKFTSTGNTFNINGLTINALATTTTEEKIANGTADGDAVTITTTTDTQGIYDKIKDFLTEYNTLINLMTSSYNAPSAGEYEPLTDDEKEAMTDSQVEKWEQKVKDSLLRRDSVLGNVLTALTSAMSKQYEINGKNYSLASFGIKTLGSLNAKKYEQNAYHIDGDADDSDVSANKDKLMAAISENPDAVMEFFQKLTSDVYGTLGKKMESTSLSSAFTLYNDKEMTKQISDYKTTISKWEDKISDIEDKYYKKFAAMEKALTEMQSKTSQLSGLLGS
ncbi:MAG: flagellar filament capping protein FliD [bacterium]|nr:flagellar filament capping protein FliD [bacterium]